MSWKEHVLSQECSLAPEAVSGGPLHPLPNPTLPPKLSSAPATPAPCGHGLGLCTACSGHCPRSMKSASLGSRCLPAPVPSRRPTGRELSVWERRSYSEPRPLPMSRAPGEMEAEALPPLEFNSTNAPFPHFLLLKNFNVHASAKHSLGCGPSC